MPLLLLPLLAALAGGAAASPVADLYRVDLLPRFRTVTVGSVSSYDRSGGNDDGFNGTWSFVRKEAGGLVIADLKGPGVITRIWTPTPSDDWVEFYFDGEKTPRLRIRFREMFAGKTAPFLAPAAGIGAGGFYSYAPLAYVRSLKILVRSQRVEFYQVNFATFAKRTKVASYPGGDDGVQAARTLLGGTSEALLAAYGPALKRQEVRTTLRPGGTALLFERDRPGRIAGLRLGPARALAGKARAVRLNVYYDGEAQPAFSVPAGDFFGAAWGDPAMAGRLAGTKGDEDYLYLPMPYDQAVRIELASDGGEAPVEVTGEVDYTDEGRRADEGRFYALWRRENPTQAGRPFTFLETGGGRGQMVGVVLQAQGLEPGAVPEFFEGDDEARIDGRVVIRGTGSEDFFNGGWYDVPGRWESRVSLPLSGSLDFKRHLGRTGGYRFLIADAYSWTRDIRATIEHGPSGNVFPSDYASTVFLYAERPPAGAGALPPVAKRAVSDPARVVFTPGWTAPIAAFSWANATLAKKDEKVDGENLRRLSLDAEGREVFGPHYISFLCEMPAAGRYRVSAQAISGPDQGILQLFRDEVAVGPAADLYSPARHKTAELALGTVELAEGQNRVMLKLVGQNARSTASGLDLYRLIFERVE